MGVITGSPSVCAVSTIALIEATPGGSWSSSGTGVATVDAMGIVTGVSAGTAVVSYTVTNSCGSTVATKPIIVDSPPSAGVIAGPLSVCTGATIALADAVPGGTWSSSGAAMATVGATGIVTGVSGGVVTISYIATNSCGSATATKDVTVNSLPSVGAITGLSSVCTGSTIILTGERPAGLCPQQEVPGHLRVELLQWEALVS